MLTRAVGCATLKLLRNVTFREVITLNVAERLIKARGDKRREEVAKAVGISLSAIAMYENGERIPRDEIKVRLADYYQTTVQKLFFD